MVLICLVAGEHSGDALGAKLMEALQRLFGNDVEFMGVGGDAMQAKGLRSLFALDEVAVMGPLSILPRLPRIVRLVYQTVDAIVAAKPDVIVIIDSPEFTHPIAKRVRQRSPEIPIIDYVSPSVWAWRPGRARKMRRYVDHVLALLPFEPDAHKRLGGPACTYVGHPLVERLEWMDSIDASALPGEIELVDDRPILVVLPGSRASEVSRLMECFGGAAAELFRRGVNAQVVVPVVGSVRSMVEEKLADWPVGATLIEGDDAKFSAFRQARAALAASGTVTLELAMAGTPMVVGYRVDPVAAPFLRRLLKIPSVVLANLVLGELAFPELIQEDCVPEKLAGALEGVMRDGPARERQFAALARIRDIMREDGAAPSDRAAQVVAGYVR